MSTPAFASGEAKACRSVFGVTSVSAASPPGVQYPGGCHGTFARSSRTRPSWRSKEGDYSVVIPDQQQALARGRVSRPLSLAAEITATGRNPDFLDHPDLMNGKDTYKLTVPADTPAKDFWSVIVYSAKTKGFVEGVDRVGLSSLEVPKMKKNADGSVDVYFAPQAPEGLESNWIPTGEDFFLLFRLYGPSEALFNKTWTLPDVEKVR